MFPNKKIRANQRNIKFGTKDTLSKYFWVVNLKNCCHM